ncbi:MAG: glycerate kinase [Phycisphaerae bacterium]|jgi:glycerate kinase|nr:glycerate kinase [Phycisphaerae bacterium]MDP7286866.1 glycerate kinase [Phycisphaerae bacterium]
MKIVIAPDTFKESISAQLAAAAIAEGVLDVCGNVQIDVCPMADGGDGTVEAMVSATGGAFGTADVIDPLGSSIRARFGLLGAPVQDSLPGQLGLVTAEMQADGEGSPGQGRVAVVEMASASGLRLVRPEDRDPMVTTTFGTGLLIMAALEAGAEEVIVAIGGSATVDGGCGAAQALGVSFVDADGEACICGMGGGSLSTLGSIDVSDLYPPVRQARIRVACDVSNPLVGPNGAATVYGPQKGATVEMVEQLENGMVRLADIVKRDLGVDISTVPGGGAAGGLGAGLVAFTGATIESGAELVASAVGLKRRLAGADLCITGEGSFDAQSASGKTVSAVAKYAREAGVAVVCIAGQVSDDAPREMFSDVRSLIDEEITASAAMRNPEPLLKARAGEAMRAFVSA